MKWFPKLGAVDPVQHTHTGIPAQMSVEEKRGTEFDDRPAGDTMPTYRGRTFRSPTVTHSHDSDIALGDTASVRINKHANRGYPNPRRVDSEPRGNPVQAPRGHEVAHGEQRVMLSAAPVIEQNPTAAPTRPKQGWTTQDNTRVARQPHSFTVRPFDQFAAQHPKTEKFEQPSPLATRSRNMRGVTHALPSPGGNVATVGGGGSNVRVQPNTVRILPRPWDAMRINTGGPAADLMDDPAQAVASSSARRGWGLR